MGGADKKNLQCKVVAVGDGAVGKTCLLIVYVNNEFPETYVPTVFETYDTQMKVNNNVIKFSLWDTAGQEEYDKLRYLSYPNTNVFIVCFSVVSKSSLDNVITRWKKEIDEYSKGTPVILVGTKADIREDKDLLDKMLKDGSADGVVTKEEAEKVAEQMGAVYMETSARLNTGVKEVFDKCLEIRFASASHAKNKKNCVIA